MAHGRQTRKTHKTSSLRRGEIYLVTLDPTIGHEIKKTRPALVIQNDTFNEFYTTTIVAPITSTVRFLASPVHVLLASDRATGLAVPSMALLDQIRAVDKRRLIRPLGQLPAPLMDQVDDAIAISLGLGGLD